jgi:hypothetical protein
MANSGIAFEEPSHYYSAVRRVILCDSDTAGSIAKGEGIALTVLDIDGLRSDANIHAILALPPWKHQ